MEEKVSVIIPCYNVEQFIDRCLTSVVEQTIGLDKLEIICVNDASTDDTWKKLCEWETRYQDHILTVNCEENGAQGRARNIALSHASGDYITFLDADDWMETDAYERAYQAMKAYDCDIVRYRWIRDDGLGNIFDTQTGETEQDYLLVIDGVEERKKFLVTDIMNHPCVNKLYKADWIKKNRLSFPEGLKYEDIYWGVMSYYYGTRIYFLNKNLYHYYINPASTVMMPDMAYHMDRFHVVRLLWDECQKRGFLKDYQKETEFNFLVHYYLDGTKTMALCYTELKYREFLEVCQTVRELVPEYKNNPYIQKILPEMEQLQIALIDQDISREEFAQLVSMLRGENYAD